MKLFFFWIKVCILYPLLFIVSAFILALIVIHFVTKPSNDRPWTDDQQVLAYAEIKENKVTIHNIRNFVYASTTSYTKQYYDKTFDVNTLKKVWYVVEPFDGVPGSAHTFLSFEFEGDQFLSISVEIRKEKGEAYHPIKGLFNQYELMYVIADERDVIKLRSNYRKDPVFVYPAKADKEKVKELFVNMVTSANELREHPVFYNTVTNNCTTEIVRHINSITPKRVPLFSYQILFPENSDKLALKLGLIDTTLSLEEARKKFYINEKAEEYKDDPEFSRRIR